MQPGIAAVAGAAPATGRDSSLWYEISRRPAGNERWVGGSL